MRSSDQTTGFSDEYMDAIWYRARQIWKSGQLQAAEDLCRQILQLNPGHADARHLSGIIAYQRGDYSEAFDRIDKAVGSSTPRADFCNNLGLTLLVLNQPRAAVRQFQTAVHLSPGCVDAYLNLGKAFEELHQGDNAAKAYGKAVELRPDFPEAHFNLARVLSSKGQLAHAIQYYHKALQLRPHFEKAWNNLGNVLRELGRLDEAVAAFRRALQLKPDYLAALNNLGNALRAKGLSAEAVDLFRQAVQVSPQSAESHCNLGNALKDSGRYAAALESYRQAIRIKPDFAEAHFNASVIYLLLGDYQKGWQQYEWRLQRQVVKDLWMHRLSQPCWQGESFVGKHLLVFDEQGFGDTLQFARFLPLAKARGGTVTFETRKALMGLFENFAGIDHVVERTSFTQPASKADLYIPLMSLPRILDVRLETIPTNVPYFHAPLYKLLRWRARITHKGFRIGLVWSGSRLDPSRSCALEHFARLTAIPGLKLYGLQKGIHAKDSDSSGQIAAILQNNLGTEFEDFADTAAVIQHLDLILTVDTAAAHLAGALGKPVWVLVPHICDWRWLLSREDSVWYPTMRLFRQRTRGNWEEVIDRITVELKKLSCAPVHLRSSENDADRQFEIGNRFYDQGKLGEAIVAYQKALALKPNFSQALYNLAKTHQEMGNHEQAVRSYEQTVEVDPSRFEALFNLATVYQDQGNFERAANYYRLALERQPDFFAAHNNLGSALLEIGQRDEAVRCFETTIQLNPQYAEAHYNLGRARLALEQLDQAAQCFQSALVLKPDYFQAYHNLGLTRHKQGRFNEAIQYYQEALRLKPDYVLAYYNLGNVFLDQEKIEDMILCYRKALQFSSSDAEACHRLGKLHYLTGKIEEAEYFYRQAIRLQADFAEAHFDRAVVLLTKGDFAEGWKEYEWRFKRSNWRKAYPFRFNRPRWEGLPFKAKRLLVHCEQGLGDTLQFVRYLPLVKTLGGSLIFETTPTLKPLFQNSPFIDELIELSPTKPTDVVFDLYIPLLSLPGVFNTTLETIPNLIPYIRVDSRKADLWHKRLDPKKLKIGIVWAGSNMDPSRACQLSQFLPLTQLNNVTIYGLQKGQGSRQIDSLTGNRPVVNLGEELNDFSDTAALIANLDLLISVDTAVAHLAGAMGKQVWVLLPYVSDWRWMRDREDSPWYPTMRLFRQKVRGDWTGVFDRIRKELGLLAAAGKYSQACTRITGRQDQAS